MTRWLTSAQPRRPAASAAAASGAPTRRGGQRRPAASVIVALPPAVVLGGLYQFNRFRSQAIANFFAHNNSPPAQVSAVSVAVATLPRAAPGVGSLAAVHQVTINPEVAGRLTRDLFEVVGGQSWRPAGAVERRPRPGRPRQLRGAGAHGAIIVAALATLHQQSFASQETVDQNASQLDQARAEIRRPRQSSRKS